MQCLPNTPKKRLLCGFQSNMPKSCNMSPLGADGSGGMADAGVRTIHWLFSIGAVPFAGAQALNVATAELGWPFGWQQAELLLPLNDSHEQTADMRPPPISGTLTNGFLTHPQERSTFAQGKCARTDGKTITRS